MGVDCFQAAESDSTASQKQHDVTIQDAKAQLGFEHKPLIRMGNKSKLQA